MVSLFRSILAKCSIVKSSAFFLIPAFLLSLRAPAIHAQAADYLIGPEDVLRVTVIGKQDYKLTEERTVSQAGSLMLSIMKEEIPVEGLSLEEADRKLTEVLGREYLVNPDVMVEMAKYQSHKVLVIGEVKIPGELVLQKENLPLKELLIATGGPLGDINKTVIILREGQDEKPSSTVLQLDEVLMQGSATPPMVRSNDVVYILGKDKSLPVHDLDNVVYVFGEVAKPGLVSYSQNLTALRAIILAGNFTKEAAPGRTSIKRREAKKLKTIGVDLDAVMSGGDKTKDASLLPGDIIYVPRAIF
jgi:polysaccharide biosynthesis/export protein